MVKDLIEKLFYLRDESELAAFLDSSPFIDRAKRSDMVETAVQKHDNCSTKSVLLLCELIGILKDGKSDLHQERKTFKHALISLFANCVKEQAAQGNKDAKKAWAEVKETAQRKVKEKPATDPSHQLAENILGQSAKKDSCVIF